LFVFQVAEAAVSINYSEAVTRTNTHWLLLPVTLVIITLFYCEAVTRTNTQPATTVAGNYYSILIML